MDLPTNFSPVGLQEHDDASSKKIKCQGGREQNGITFRPVPSLLDLASAFVANQMILEGTIDAPCDAVYKKPWDTLPAYNFPGCHTMEAGEWRDGNASGAVCHWHYSGKRECSNELHWSHNGEWAPNTTPTSNWVSVIIEGPSPWGLDAYTINIPIYKTAQKSGDTVFETKPPHYHHPFRSVRPFNWRSVCSVDAILAWADKGPGRRSLFDPKEMDVEPPRVY